MSAFRMLTAAGLGFTYAFLVVHAAGCGTDAVGVDECRDIEEARCEAGAFCDVVEDVAACKRFYRDQCLHGLAAKDRPGAPQLKACLNTIKLAGECAKGGIENLADCPVPTPSAKTIHTKVYDVVLSPQDAAECEFLAEPVELPVPDAAAEAAPGDAASGDAAGGG